MRVQQYVSLRGHTFEEIACPGGTGNSPCSWTTLMLIHKHRNDYDNNEDNAEQEFYEKFGDTNNGAPSSLHQYEELPDDLAQGDGGEGCCCHHFECQQ